MKILESYIKKEDVDNAFLRERDLYKTVINTSAIASKINQGIELDEWNKRDINRLVLCLADLHKMISDEGDGLYISEWIELWKKEQKIKED